MTGLRKRIFGAVLMARLIAPALLTGCATMDPIKPVILQGLKLDNTPRLAVVAAYETELDVLLPLIETSRSTRVNGVDFYTGTIEGQDVVVFMTSISLVNAAMNTQLLLDHYNIEGIVISGVAGGLSPDLSYADVTVPARWGQYNEMIYMRQEDDGSYVAPTGLGVGFAPFEYMKPRGMRVPSITEPNPADRKFWFDVDPELMTIAKQAASTVTLKGCTETGKCLPRTPEIVFDGNGVTGSVFMDNAKFRQYLNETFDASTVEMETSAIGHVAYANNVPYIAFRSLSDLAGGGEGANQWASFEKLASDNNVILLKAFLRAYD